jgi:hypothetical protein
MERAIAESVSLVHGLRPELGSMPLSHFWRRARQELNPQPLDLESTALPVGATGPY